MEAIFRNIRGIVAMTVTFCSFAFLFTLTRVEIPSNNKDLINIAAGLVLAALAGVVNYYFGSSKDKSDQEKASIIKDQNIIT
jgi:high-affinity Fe2+/Pb2+ permease